VHHSVSQISKLEVSHGALFGKLSSDKSKAAASVLLWTYKIAATHSVHMCKTYDLNEPQQEGAHARHEQAPKSRGNAVRARGARRTKLCHPYDALQLCIRAFKSCMLSLVKSKPTGVLVPPPCRQLAAYIKLRAHYPLYLE